MKDFSDGDIESLFGGGDQAQDGETEVLEAAEPIVATEPYDFNEATFVPEGQKRTVELVFERYAQSAKLALSAFLRADVDMSLVRAEQMVYSQYAVSLVNPTCVATFDMQPLGGYGIMEINSAVLYAIVNRMLGGALNVPIIGRAFTELELAIVRRFVKLLLSEMDLAWRFVLNMDCHLKDIQTNPAFVRVISKQENCLIITLKLKLADTTGLLSFCIPYSNLEPIANKLDNDRWQKYKVQQTDEERVAHQRNMGQVEVDLKAVLGSIELSIDDLLALQVGDVVNLECKTTNPVALRVAGVNKFAVNPGLVGRYKGVRIHKEIKEVMYV